MNPHAHDVVQRDADVAAQAPQDVEPVKPHGELARDHTRIKDRGPSDRRQQDGEDCDGGGCCAQVKGTFTITGECRPA